MLEVATDVITLPKNVDIQSLQGLLRVESGIITPLSRDGDIVGYVIPPGLFYDLSNLFQALERTQKISLTQHSR